jgi:hypothetical protein
MHLEALEFMGKSRRPNLLALVGLWLTLTIGFNNCTGVAFSSGGDGQNKTTGTPPPILPPPAEVIKNCDNAAANGTLQTISQSINFEDTGVETGHTDHHDICPFDQGDNLGMRDSHMRARYEQERALNLPANAVICDVTATTQLQSFRYDDIFWFSFNGFLLATNNKTALYERQNPDARLKTTSGKLVDLYKYNWLKIRDAHFANVADDYCLGNDEGLASCSWPITEQQGNISFQFDKEILMQLGLQSLPNFQAFKFVITGDNDPNVDCYHEKLEFQMTVKYYLK